MRKVGKYEKMRKNALLSSYITSVLCLVLCVTMFFGTTAAWFTDTTTSEQNQIYVGTLAVDLGFAAVTKESNGQETTYTAVAETVPIFDDSIRWEPGYTAIRKFELTEKGDLAFSYQMGIDFTYSTDAATKAKEEAVAQAISVWQYVGDNAAAYSLPADYETMVTQTTGGEQDWELVGTLKQVIDNHIPVFTGKMDKATVAADQAKAYHLIALNMDKTYGDDAADLDIQGTQLKDITIKLVATQLPGEEDAFGNTYDQMPVDIVVAKEVTVANNQVAAPVILSANSNSAVSYASVEVPTGAAVKAGTTALTLNVKAAENKNAGTVVTDGKKVMPLLISVEGIATDNAQVIPVKLLIAKGLTNVEVYHKGVPMVAADTKEENTFTYNAVTGELELYVKNFSPFDIVYRDDGVAEVATSAELEAAVKSGATKILLADGEYDVASCGGKTLTISGSKNAVIKVDAPVNNYPDYSFDGSEVVFNGVTIKTNNQTYSGYSNLKATFNDCHFDGSYTLYGDSTFNDCTFNVAGDQYNIWTWAAPAASFNNCTFNSDGKAILMYGGANTKLTVIKCTFNDSGVLPDMKAAIEIGNGFGAKYELIANSNTVNGYEINNAGTNTGTTLWGNKNSMSSDELNVVIDGIDVY